MKKEGEKEDGERRERRRRRREEGGRGEKKKEGGEERGRRKGREEKGGRGRAGEYAWVFESWWKRLKVEASRIIKKSTKIQKKTKVKN